MTNGIYGNVRRAFAFVIVLVMLFGCIGFASAETEPAEPVRGASDFYLVGSMNGWNVNEDYKLTQNTGAGTTEYMITLNLAAGDAFKVVKGEKVQWYPGGSNNDYTISEAGNYTVYFRPNYDGETGWHYDCLYAVKNSSSFLYNVSVTASAGGTAAADKTNAAVGSTVTVTITPNAGWYYSGVTGQPADWSYNESTGKATFAMPGNDVNLTVTFAQYPTLTATCNSNGTVRASAAYAKPGDLVSITATPDEGYEVKSVTGLPEDCTVSNGFYSFSMPDTDVNAVFTFGKIVYSIDVTKTGEGTVVVEGTPSIGETITLTVIPAEGYWLSAFSADDVSYALPLETNVITFDMPLHNVPVVATFSPLGETAHAVTVQVKSYNANNEEVVALGTAFANKTQAKHGEIITITTEGTIGYSLDHIEVGSETLTGNRFIMPDNDVTVTAVFKEKPYVVELVSNEAGMITAVPRDGHAYANTTVRIAVTPNENYSVTLTVTNKKTGQVVAVSAPTQSGKTFNYTFTMPEADVKVVANYTKLVRAGYYLIGRKGWTFDKIDPDDRLMEDPHDPGKQWILTTNIPAGNYKVVQVSDTAIVKWIPENGNGHTGADYTVSEGGNYIIYCRPDYSVGNRVGFGWHEDCLRFQKVSNEYYLINLTGSTNNQLRTDDKLFINKEFNPKSPVKGNNNEDTTLVDLYGITYEHMVLTWLDANDKIKVVRYKGTNNYDYIPDTGNGYPTYINPDSTQAKLQYGTTNASNVYGKFDGMVFVFFEEELGSYSDKPTERRDWTNKKFDVQKAFKADAADKAEHDPLNGDALTYNLKHGNLKLSTGTPFFREGRSDAGRIPTHTDKIIYELGIDQSVYCTITPEAGYTLDGTPYITYTENGVEKTVNMTQSGDRWYFKMPRADVVIHAPMHKVFRTQSVMLSGWTGINFYVDLTNLSDTDKAGTYMQFYIGDQLLDIWSDGEEADRDNYDANDHSARYPDYNGFSCTVNALQMADIITAKLFKADGTLISSKDYSLEQYVTYFDRTDSSTTAANDPGSGKNNDALRVIRAMLDFGYYMQQYLFEVNPSISADYTHVTKPYANTFDFEGIKAATASHETVKQLGESKVSDVTLQIAVDSATALMLNLKMADATVPTITVGSETLTVGNSVTQGAFTWKLIDKGNQVYQLRIEGISPHNLDRKFTVRGNAGSSFTIEASAFSYVYSMLKNGTSESGKKAAAAMYMFHEAEVAYRNSISYDNNH
jgi:hypothetical protein